MVAMGKKIQKVVRKGESVQGYVPHELAAALKAFIETSRPRLTKGAILESAIEDWLRARGAWPPTDQPQR